MIRKERLREEILAVIPGNMRLGFYLYDTHSKQSIGINEHEWFPLASITKWITSIFVAAHHTVEEDELFSAVSEHSGSAYGKLCEKLPENTLNERLKGLEIDCRVTSENDDTIHNCGTPAGLFKVMNLLFFGPDQEKMTAIIEGMKLQTDPDGFRFNGHWNHMTGGLAGVCNDVGYVKTEEGEVMVIGLLHTNDETVEWESLEKVMNRIGELISEANLLPLSETKYNRLQI
ncbi:serine hydrolase [Bacillus sp. KH172YL63]|uniref:serine hydrolase n=1 Tax=Bacillus sp. KH172YL63 TaxID=2709784 RepID=UPI0013E4A5DB|nr:serine hydrolase [Bacillus sp. KH172YL63]BCB03606.1 hypothetical protein KH172YL63_17390 [Bacillus sp. KH172YL63]